MPLPARRPRLEPLEDRTAPAAGQLDPTFGTGGRAFPDFGTPGQAVAAAVQPDGKVVVAGAVGGFATSDFAVARLTPDGQPDPTFGTGGFTTIDLGQAEFAFAVAVQPDGKVLVAGTTDDGAGGSDFAVVRLTAAGQPDPTFGTGGSATVDFGGSPDRLAGLAVLPDGRIVVGGDAGFEFAAARLTAAGQLDPTFGAGGRAVDAAGPSRDSSGVVVQPDGAVVVVGYTQGGPVPFVAAVRFTAAGQLDAGFGTGGRVTEDYGVVYFPTGVALQPDGKLVIGGFVDGPSDRDFAAARLTAAGQRDTGFGTGGLASVNFGVYDTATGVAVQPDGKLVLGGFVFDGSGYAFAAARLEAAGQPDPTFGTGGQAAYPFGGQDMAAALALQPDGKVVLAGSYPGPAGVAPMAVRLTADLPAGPATFVWDGRADGGPVTPDDNWSDPRNWVGDVAPTGLAVNHETLSFPAGAARLTGTNDLAGAAFTALSFTGSGYTLGGDPVTLGGATALSAGPGVAGFLGLDVALAGPAGGSQTFDMGPGSNLAVGGRVSGAGGLVVAGGGTAFLTGDNTYAGGTVVRAGALDWGSAGALGTGPVQVGDAQSPPGANPFLRGSAATLPNDVLVTLPGAVVGSFPGAQAAGYSGTLTLALPAGGAVFLLAGSPATTTFSGRITGTGDVVAWSPDGPGRVVVLDNATGRPNDFHRPAAPAAVFIEPGAVLRLVVGPGRDELPDTASITFADATSTLELVGPGGTETVGPLFVGQPGAGRVRAGSAGAFTLGLNTSTTSAQFTGSITDGAGALTLTKAGASAAVLGPVAVSGPVVVTDGQLILDGPVADGPAAPDVVVTGTGSLLGTGTVAGTVEVRAGGKIEPATFPGNTALRTGSLTFQPGSALSVQPVVGLTDVAIGRLAVTGSVALGGATLAVGPAIGNAIPPRTTLVILANDGADPVVGTFAGLPEGGRLAAGGVAYRVSYVGGDGNDVTLSVPLSVAVSPAALPAGRVGAGYAAAVSASGPPGPFAFAVTSGVLPPGLALSAAGGLTGTPTTAGSWGFVVTATTAAGDTGSRAYTVTVEPAGATSPPPPPGGLGPVRPVAVGGAADGSVRLVTAGGVTTASPFGPLGVPVRTASGDVDGDGVADVVAATGPGTPLRVAVVSGATGRVIVPAFDPFGGNFPGGGYVAAADLDGDGRAEFAVTPDQGGGPRVTVFTQNPNGSRSVRANFFGIDDENFRGGARAALGDVNGDGVPDVVVAAGFGGGPRTAIFTGQSVLAGSPARLVNDFFAFPGSDAVNLRNGAFVAAGDVDGDGFADLVFGGGPGGAPRVFILSGAALTAGDVAGAYARPVANFFFGGDPNDRGGARVAVTNSDGDRMADVAVGSGAGSPARVRVYLGKDVGGGGEPPAADLDPLGGAVLADGLYVG